MATATWQLENGKKKTRQQKKHPDRFRIFSPVFRLFSTVFSGCRKKEVGKRSSITFFRFRDSFGHFLVTFSDAPVTFFVTFLPNSSCWTPFAAG